MGVSAEAAVVEDCGGPGGARERRRGVPWAGTWAGLLCGAAVATLLCTVALHGTRGGFVGWLAVVVCGLAGLFDAWTTRIPNRLTYVAILLGLGLNGAAGIADRAHWEAAVRWLAAPGPAQSVLGFGVCAAVGIVGMVVARVGGGDIKLLAALGAMLGLSQTGAVLVVALTVAVVYAVINLAAAGGLNRFARGAAWKAMEAIYLGRLEFDHEDKGAGSLAVPMAVPLAIGVLVVQVMGVRLGGRA